MGEANPFEIFEFALKQLVTRFPKLSYVHLVESREWAPGSASTKHHDKGIVPSNDRFRAIVRGMDPDSIEVDKIVFPDPTPEHPTVFISASEFAYEQHALSTAHDSCHQVVSTPRTSDLTSHGLATSPPSAASSVSCTADTTNFNAK